MALVQKIIVLKEVNIPEAIITLRSDRIMLVHYNKDITIDVETQLMMREIYKQMAPGKRLDYIFSASSGVSFTKEARENPSDVANSPIASYAIIANNLAYRLIANFYLKVIKPRVPYRLFSDIDEAVEWLHSRNS